jgi:hypothetical protein
MQAITASATKREVATMIGRTAARISSLVLEASDGSLTKAWSGLPAGGAFAGASVSVPTPYASQAHADALVAEAIADSPIEITWNQRECVVNLLLAMFNITGSMAFPRGWVRSVMLAFDAAEHPVPPTPSSLRWYRRQLQNEPQTFAGVWGADPRLIQDLIERTGCP